MNIHDTCVCRCSHSRKTVTFCRKIIYIVYVCIIYTIHMQNGSKAHSDNDSCETFVNLYSEFPKSRGNLKLFYRDTDM